MKRTRSRGRKRLTASIVPWWCLLVQCNVPTGTSWTVGATIVEPRHSNRRDEKETNTTTTIDSTDIITEDIVNGNDISAQPFYGISKENELCGCVLIHPDILLSVAHCAGVFRDGIYLNNARLDGKDGILVDVQYELPHSFYNAATLRNDLMIIKLRRPVNLATLPLSTRVLQPNDVVTAMGFGAQKEDGPISKTLQAVNLRYLDLDRCRQEYDPIALFDSMLCTSGTGDACQGDSGGPLLYQNELVGLISFGIGCHRFPGIYTRVSSFVPYIHSAICQFSSVPGNHCGSKVDSTEKPTLRPITAAPTPQPSTPAPTQQPTTAAPTLQPTTAVPTVQPTTAAPIQTTPPPTPSPTAPPPTHFVILGADAPCDLQYICSNGPGSIGFRMKFQILGTCLDRCIERNHEHWEQLNMECGTC